ncbi:hypothetical protein P152DRAFT_480109 [Eremomyces bilateralis CBS 781.70]|uniref:Magnesium chelatase n=1 Tax=Eremomyces bilateralis CBS 781.70 TaxID=1392243 RepID=A0A6G1GAG8_9PEZI|nr:uncharacterized protein P152DRAFT_480109 [Eremomyces bilateralis CBS 781.70]KAF1815002.1 hypothetical protein P152DRAFT_480109 [Eremomyces bilateralis CBS 781.70]
MASESITEKAGTMSDLELAVLLGLIAGQHVLIRSNKAQKDLIAQEVELICLNLVGLQTIRLHCHQTMTLEDLAESLLIDTRSGDDDSLAADLALGSKRIANAVVVENLDFAPHAIQIQILELMRGKRMFTRNAVYSVPKRFIVVGLVTSPPTQTLNGMLNDHFFMSHTHLPEDDTPNVTKSNRTINGVEESVSQRDSVRPGPLPSHQRTPPQRAFISVDELESLKTLSTQVKMNTEVRGYLHDIVVHLRMHRAAGGGVSALATRHFHSLVNVMAPLHGVNYVTPSIVVLAARKIYAHRLAVTKPEDERSLQWGSSLQAVRKLLDGVTVEGVIEDVLENVKPPL